jgi:hypothetical protein
MLSIAYSIFFSVLMFFFLRRLLIRNFAFLGAILSIGLLITVLRRPLGPTLRTARLWALDHAGSIRRHQLPLVGVAALLAGAFFLIPVPGHRTLRVTIEPIREVALVAPEELRLKQASFVAGQSVSQGQVLAVLDADSLMHDWNASAAAARVLFVQEEAARIQGQDVEAIAARTRGQAASQQSGWVARRVERALLRAPFDGRVLTPSIKGLTGQLLLAGDTLCMVGDFSAMRASAWISELDLDDVPVGAAVRIRLRANPGEVLTGQVIVIEDLPSGSRGEPAHRMWIGLDTLPSLAMAGLTGTARIATPARTPAAHVAKWVAHFLRLDLWV